MFLSSHPRRSAVTAATVIAVLLAGCASTGGLHTQGKAIAANSLHAQRSLSGIDVDGAAWPQADWWKALGDPQLDKLVDEALAGNPDMALVDARVRGALAEAGAADAERQPTLNGGAAVAGARVPPLLPPLASGHFGVIRYGYLSFKWNFDLWGGKRAAWEAAIGKARAAEIDARAARLNLAANVVRSYIDLGGAVEQRKLAEAELKRAQDFLALTKKRVANGIDSRFTLARIEGETASARGHLREAANTVRTDRIVLAALLGAGPDRALEISPPARPPHGGALALPSNLPADLLGRRPDVVAARWRVEAAGKDIKSAKAAFLPNLGISSLAGLIAPSAISLFSLTSRFYMVSPALSVPIFEGGKLRANLSGKDAAYDMAVAQYDKTLVGAINQIATVSDDLRSLDEQIDDATQARDSAEQAYALAMKRYRAGVGNYLEALSVRQELIAAERQLAALRTRRSDAWVALNEALGGGFRPGADAPSVAVHAGKNDHKANR
jgi:NodT family efflux transporter outer membrane factor (OMF) lipoprotein